MAQHHTERQYRQHYMSMHKGWYCTVCRRWWTREPVSRCPGVPAYETWDDAHAAGLRTVTQWQREHRRVPANAQVGGAMWRGPAHPEDYYWLYAEDQTIPMRQRRLALPDAPGRE